MSWFRLLLTYSVFSNSFFAVYVLSLLCLSELVLTDQDQAQCEGLSTLGAVFAGAKYGQH